MEAYGKAWRTIWIDENESLAIIDQTLLPHEFSTPCLETPEAVRHAITDMQVRGAGLIGATAAYGMWLVARNFQGNIAALHKKLAEEAVLFTQTRPTAANLVWAVKRQLAIAAAWRADAASLTAALKAEAEAIANEDAEFCRNIGIHGLEIIKAISAKKNGKVVNILTHCNAGWLAFVDYGSALAPVYAAQAAKLKVHVWVDETRPRNQGAGLTAWELSRAGLAHTLIADNTGGHLMREGMVDMVITGADRVTRTGDVANKIGTYLKALAACDNNIPFYVAFPSSTLDFSLGNQEGTGKKIPIEERSGDEVRFMRGLSSNGELTRVLVCPKESPARNWAFDVTPARLITGLICERGLCAASEKSIAKLFPEHPRSDS